MYVARHGPPKQIGRGAHRKVYSIGGGWVLKTAEPSRNNYLKFSFKSIKSEYEFWTQVAGTDESHNFAEILCCDPQYFWLIQRRCTPVPRDRETERTRLVKHIEKTFNIKDLKSPRQFGIHPDTERIVCLDYARVGW